jgi:hypothetical protein
MNAKVITIKDGGNGDSVKVAVGKRTLMLLNHDDDGWAGIERGIVLTKAIAKEFDIEVIDTQDIV